VAFCNWKLWPSYCGSNKNNNCKVGEPVIKICSYPWDYGSSGSPINIYLSSGNEEEALFLPATSAECSVAAAFEAGNDAQKQKQHQKLAIWLQQQTNRTLEKILFGI